MPLLYHAEYRLGWRGGRVCHTYTGPAAALAIAVNLTLALLIGLIRSVVALAAFAVVATWRVVAGVAAFALLAIGSLAAGLLALVAGTGRAVGRLRPRGSVGKPAWAGLDEL